MMAAIGSTQDRLCFIPELAVYFAGHQAPIIVTGATGWLGQATLEMLDSALGNQLQARVHAFSSSETLINLRSGQQIRSRALHDLDNMALPAAIIFHYAFLTREHAFEQPLADYKSKNNEITRIICDTVTRHGALGIFIPSSGAVYSPAGKLDENFELNPYGVLKYQDEIRFQNLAQRLAIPCAIMRVFNLSGPFINKLSSYALGSMIQDGLSGGPIVLRAHRKVFRSYAYAQDVVNLGAAIIKRQVQTPPFDTAGERRIEIGDLAGLVAKAMPAKDVNITRPEISVTEQDVYCGNGDLYFRLANEIGLNLKLLDEQIIATITYVQSMSR